MEKINKVDESKNHMKAERARFLARRERKAKPEPDSSTLERGPAGEKTVWKAERAWFLDRRERRAKPEIEQLLPRWGKSCVFLNLLARALYWQIMIYIPQLFCYYEAAFPQGEEISAE
jgi:hypothetical protein